MFALIYRWRVLPGRDEAFIRAWARLTEIIYERDGSLGSRLHRSDDGTYIAYAQWPSREVWEASSHIEPTEEALRLRRIIQESAERLRPDTQMIVIEDHLVFG
jgi:heme-degrading monooxygenase HmoA